MRNCRREIYKDFACLIIDFDEALLDHMQLLQCQRMLWVIDKSYQICEKKTEKLDS